MELVKIDDENFLEFRLTPWDSKVLEKRSNEVIAINYSNEKNLNLLIEEFEKKCKTDEIGFSIARANSNDKILRKILQLKGFYFAESSLKISKSDIQKTDFVGNRKPLELVQMKEDHLAEVQKIAYSDFNHGRLIEDPFLDEELGRKRSRNWIEDLWTQSNEKFVWEKNNEILGFHFQKVFIEESRADLILSGVRSKESMFSVFFWATFLEMLKQREIKRTDTLISTANLGVLNLYIHFQFRIKETLFGFHKIR